MYSIQYYITRRLNGARYAVRIPELIGSELKTPLTVLMCYQKRLKSIFFFCYDLLVIVNVISDKNKQS